MSNLKKVTKIARKAYKKVPKKKLVNKAATYGVKQVIGGPYLDIIGILYKKTKKKAVSYAGSYAYDSFLRSKFARDKINSLPISLVALTVRIIANFLIFSRMITGIRLLDFGLSMIVTIVITLLAPFFYTSIKAHEETFLLHTNRFIDRFMGPGGWEYVEDAKNRLLFFVGVVLLIILQFIKIDSRYLQEMILHALITGFISDKIQRWIDEVSTVRRLYYGMTNTQVDAYVLTPKNYVNTRYKRVNVCHTDNRVIIGGHKPQRAVVVSIDLLKEYTTVDRDPKLIIDEENEEKQKKQELTCVDIVDDYNSNHLHITG